METNLDFQALSALWGLGETLAPPTPLTGGFLHLMFRLETEKGVYAAKALNPGIMARPEAVGNYLQAEKIAQDAKKAGIRALTALTLNGEFLVKTGEQYWILFPWAEGRTLREDEITPPHARKIGWILGRLHGLYPPVRQEEAYLLEDRWAEFVRRGEELSAPWTARLREKERELRRWTAEGNAAGQILAQETVLSHRDLDPKNVLWQDGEPLPIDWEAAGPVNPLQEMVDTALYWSAGGEDSGCLTAFLESYRSVCTRKADERTLDAVMSAVLAGKLDWLRYNLSRSLGDEAADEAEQKLGTVQVRETLESIERFNASRPALQEAFCQVLCR